MGDPVASCKSVPAGYQPECTPENGKSSVKGRNAQQNGRTFGCCCKLGVKNTSGNCGRSTDREKHGKPCD